MSSSFSAIISYLKPLLSDPDYDRLNHDLVLRESTWKSQNDSISHRLTNVERHNLAMSKELEHRRCAEGELHLKELDLEKKLTEANAELGSLREKLAQSSSADFVKFKRKMDDYEVKLAESKKDLEILNKQCLNWSKENGDLKAEIAKVGMREKTMCEKMKQDLEMEKLKRHELEKKMKKAEDRSESIVKYATVIYKEFELRVAKMEQWAAEWSGPQADSSINVNEGQQTNAQETTPCLQKASITSRPIVELTDSDEDEKFKMPKRKPSALEASENRSKQLKGTDKESVNTSRSVAASQIEHENAVQDDDSAECWEYEADILQALEKDTELCMKAVCALYQQHRRPVSGYIALNVFFNPREVALAKFLVDGDQEGRLKRSVAELEKYDPNGSVICRKIAFNHSALLFEIYKSKVYRFFAPNSQYVLEMLLRLLTHKADWLID